MARTQRGVERVGARRVRERPCMHIQRLSTAARPALASASARRSRPRGTAERPPEAPCSASSTASSSPSRPPRRRPLRQRRKRHRAPLLRPRPSNRRATRASRDVRTPPPRSTHRNDCGPEEGGAVGAAARCQCHVARVRAHAGIDASKALVSSAEPAVAVKRRSQAQYLNAALLKRAALLTASCRRRRRSKRRRYGACCYCAASSTAAAAPPWRQSCARCPHDEQHAGAVDAAARRRGRARQGLRAPPRRHAPPRPAGPPQPRRCRACWCAQPTRQGCAGRRGADW